MENKFTLKFLKTLFKNLSKEWNDKQKIEILERDPFEFEQLIGVLEEIYGFTNQDEKDWIYASFVENWLRVNGDFDNLTEENLYNPTEKTFEVEEHEWWDVRIDKYTKARGYTKAIVASDLYNGFIDADDEETEWLERSDSEIDIKEIIGKDLKKDEKN